MKVAIHSERERRIARPAGARALRPERAPAASAFRSPPRSLLARELAAAVHGRYYGEALDAVRDVLRSPGSPLPPSVREAMEEGFGADFSHVRVHADPQAAASARAVDALAYTVGNHVVLGAGQAPRVGRLLAHELAHVLQQGDVSPGDDLVVGDPETPAEREATSAADALETGRLPVIRQRADLLQREGEQEQTWYEAAGEWTLGAIGGEWVDEQTFGQIGADFVLSVIPVVDQVADARDLAAHIYRLGFKGEHTQWTRWLGLVFTLIGLIPELGSVIKSASKAVMKGVGELLGHAGELLALARRLVPDIGDLRRLEELIVSNWSRAVEVGTRAWHTILARGSDLAARIPRLLASARERVGSVFRRLREATGEHLGRAFQQVRETIANGFRRLRESVAGATPPSPAKSDEIEQSFAATFSAQTPPPPVQTTQRLIRGNVGERLAAESLSSRGHTILMYKPDIAGTNQPGIDMVTFVGGVVHLVDNKALTRAGNVSSVSALTTNFAQNLASVRAELAAMVADASRPAAERGMLQQALTAIDAGSFVRVVTNANVARDTQILSGVTQTLQQQGIQFLNVF